MYALLAQHKWKSSGANTLAIQGRRCPELQYLFVKQSADLRKAISKGDGFETTYRPDGRAGLCVHASMLIVPTQRKWTSRPIRESCQFCTLAESWSFSWLPHVWASKDDARPQVRYRDRIWQVQSSQKPIHVLVRLRWHELST